MCSNFSKVYKGKEWKDLMCKASSVYTVQEFEYYMNVIKEIDKGAYKYLMSEKPKTWARCMYRLRSKCNRMDNNTSEAFNEAIKDAMDEPILTMLESIIRQEMAMAEDLEMIMAKEMIIAEERGLVPCTSSGREKDNNTGSGRGKRREDC
ncbi:hypothetical protein RHMOL_Rhmol08G0176600 [Rhododendron molle]|uniref:Uncharacterized protein n=1 Tax=Rhododendron molle TaxID=49168 RepID=A0ACC0MQ69_RHOML|nr:hypothetical protein RHMOL_Rhmol08G0176600 [Rhododendron molle]